MNNLSLSKLGGQCMIAGGVISFIPFLFQILAGGTPPDNENIFSFFANNTANAGSLGILYTLMSVLGTALVMYGISNLNGYMQKQKNEAVLSLGTFLFILGQFAGLIGWSLDPAIIIAKDTANISNIFVQEMSIFFMFGPLIFLGSGLISLVLANRGFANALFMKISAVVFFLVIPVFIYTAFNITDPITHNSEATVLPLFASISVAQIISLIWQIIVGSKMMKN